MNSQFEVLELYDAVLENNGILVSDLLSKNFTKKSASLSKILRGILVISIENSLNNASNAILNYNRYALSISEAELDDIKLYAKAKNLFFPKVIIN